MNREGLGWKRSWPDWRESFGQIASGYFVSVSTFGLGKAHPSNRNEFLYRLSHLGRWNNECVVMNVRVRSRGYVYCAVRKVKGEVKARTGHEGPEGSRGVVLLCL